MAGTRLVVVGWAFAVGASLLPVSPIAATAEPLSPPQGTRATSTEAASAGAVAAAVTSVGPVSTSGEDFGAEMLVLDSGNLVVTDPSDAVVPGDRRGAVHLFDGGTGTLLRSSYGLAGARAFSLPGGDYLVMGARDGGTSTVIARCDGRTGCPAVLDASNALVGPPISTTDAAVTPLAGGGWVLVAPGYTVGGSAPVGASLGCFAPGRCVGAVDEADLLTGSTFAAGQWMRAQALPAGGYVVVTPQWSNGPVAAVGAVTRCADAPCRGAVSTANSLYGTADTTDVGNDVEVLPNGDLLISAFGVLGRCPAAVPCIGRLRDLADTVEVPGEYADIDLLPNGSYLLSRGKVWCPSTPGCPGRRDWLATPHLLTVLSDGNYVVSGVGPAGGFVQWCDAERGCESAPTPMAVAGIANHVAALTGGRYVVQRGSGAAASVQVCSRGGCTTASPPDVLVGPTPTSDLGSSGVTALPNGAFVIASSHWDDGGRRDLGATMWCGPAVSCTGVATRDRVLYGSHLMDRVTVLADGSYVVTSPSISSGPVGVRWCPSDRPCTGPVTAETALMLDHGDGGRATVSVWPVVDDLYVISASQSRIGSVVGPVRDTFLLRADEVVGRASVVPADIPAGATNVVVDRQRGVAWIRIEGGLLYRWNTAASVPSPRGEGFTALRPVRLVDTRTEPSSQTIDGQWLGTGMLAPGATVEIEVAGRGQIARAATALGLNVTVTEPMGAGFVTVWPCGPRPNASNLNVVAGRTVANSVTTGLSARGTVCVSSSVATHLVIDGVAAYGSAAGLSAIVPARLLETRRGPGLATVDGVSDGDGPLAGGRVLAVPVLGRAGLPSDAASVVLNVTVTEPEADGFLTLWPCGLARPNASNVNFAAGETVAGAVTVQPGEGGRVCVFSNVTTHVVADASGWMSSGSGFAAVAPARLLETRLGRGLGTVDGLSSGLGRPIAGAVLRLQVTGRAGVAPGARSAVLTVTATESVGSGYVTLWPCDGTRPLTSTLNVESGRTVANSTVAVLDADGGTCIFLSASTHLLVDVSGHRSR